MPYLFSRPDEILAVVDDQDREIGSERRDVIHKTNLLHRAVHVFVFRSDGLLLLQQRSATKDTYPLHWECVGGHLSPGEDYDLAAQREVAEELGARVEYLVPMKKLPACPETGFEFIMTYQALILESPVPCEHEVADIEWKSCKEWEMELGIGTRTFSPTLLHSLHHTGVLKSGFQR